jgi:hypothetical protein
MPTPKQIQANRSDAQLSTAPRTEHGELEHRQTLRRPLQTGAGSPVTDSPQTGNPEIGFVPQSRVQALRLASFRQPPRRPRRCQPPPPRYTVNSDSNSPHAHG